MNTRKERINEAYMHLRSRGLVHTQKDLAAALHTTEPNVSNMLKGNERALTDSILLRLCQAFPGTFSYRWLATGEGEMLEVSPNVETDTKQETAAQRVADAMGLLAELSALRSELKEARDELRIASALLSQFLEIAKK